jgi:hypothetical protein
VRALQGQISRRRRELAEAPPSVTTFGPDDRSGDAIDWIIK